MIASRLMPRSPVWLRKIPSTVSGSQGSRRGSSPAVRFAFPLGARLNITLRARPCQELFSESFSRPSRGPRGAPPSGLLPFAATSSVLYAPPARRGRETRPHTGCRQLQRGKAGGRGMRGGRGVPNWRFAPVHMEPPRRPGACAPRPSGAFDSAACIQLPIYKLKDWAHLQTRSPSAFDTQAVLPPYRWSFLIRLRQTSHEANTSRGYFRRPGARRKAPSCNRP